MLDFNLVESWSDIELLDARREVAGKIRALQEVVRPQSAVSQYERMLLVIYGEMNRRDSLSHLTRHGLDVLEHRLGREDAAQAVYEHAMRNDAHLRAA